MKAIDLFAGAGGASEGARQAGCDIVWAGNHWPEAVKYHSMNHPGTKHVCQDLQQADWSLLPDFDMVWASPCCTGFTKARGKDRKEHDAARSTAWAVVSCAEAKRPRFMVVENVPEFTGWILFKPWLLAMEALGYRMTWQTLNAADFGVPQSRERIFLVGCLDQEIEIVSPGVDHVAARSIIDWDYKRWNWVDKKGRAERTLNQIRGGRERYGDEFLIAYYGSEKYGRDLDKPLGTVMTRDRHAIVKGDMMRMLQVHEYKLAMGFPSDYQIPGTPKKLGIHLLGNAVCPPVAKSIVEQIRAVS